MASRADLIVFAKDFPEERLMVAIKKALTGQTELDSAVQQLGRYMWGANCHFGLIVTAEKTYVLREDFQLSGPQAIHVTDILPTSRVLSRLDTDIREAISERELDTVVRAWLTRLADAYEDALPEDPEVVRALFPDIVGAVADGRVVAEVAA